jgi:hypothetical protein
VAIFSFFSEKYPQFYFFIFEKYSPHLGQKTFCGEFSPTIWRKAFQKQIVKYTFSQKKKKTLKIAMFLHIVQASSQDI